jgi:hypothetical protein
LEAAHLPEALTPSLEQAAPPLSLSEALTPDQCARLGKGLVEITDSNRPFTFFNKRSGQTEVAYQGSAVVVSILELAEYTQRQAEKYAPRVRPMMGTVSFIDKNGNFYDCLTLESLHLDGQASSVDAKKHIAVFASGLGEDKGKFSIAIENIYAASLSAHPNYSAYDYEDN